MHEQRLVGSATACLLSGSCERQDCSSSSSAPGPTVALATACMPEQSSHRAAASEGSLSAARQPS